MTEEDEPLDLADGRLVALVCTAVLSLGVALGMEAFPWLLGGARVEAQSVVARRRTGSLSTFLNSQSPVTTAPAAVSGRAMTVGELLSSLNTRRADASGVKFARAFLADAPLAGILEDFRRRPDAEARELVRALQASDEFSRLVAEHSTDPAFRRLAEEVARDPRTAALLRAVPAEPPPKPAETSGRPIKE